MRRELCYSLALSLMAVGGYAASPPQDALHAEAGSSPEADRIVATVNGRPILGAQLKPALEKGLRRFRRFGMRKESPELVRSVRERTLGELIDRELVHQESQKLSIQGVAEKVEQELQALKTKHGPEQRFARYLQIRGLTEVDLRESLETRVCMDEYLKRQGVLDPEIPEERIREAYEANPKSYSREETVQVSHILIQVDQAEARAEEKEQAKQEARQIRREILDGKDFAEMAKTHSDCNSASGGGGLGRIKRGFMPEEFDGVAFAMEVNAVSEVVESEFGYHIIMVLDKKAAGVIPYDEVRDFIRKFLQEKESKVKLAAHVAELREKATIEIMPDQP